MREMVRHCCVCEKIAVIESRDNLSASMAGWLVVTQIHAHERYECLSFCSIDCLQSWIDSHKTTVPEVFELSFGDCE